MWLWYFNFSRHGAPNFSHQTLLWFWLWTHDLRNPISSSLASSTPITNVWWNSVHWCSKYRAIKTKRCIFSANWTHSDLELWPDPKTWSVHPCPMLKVCWNSVQQFVRHRANKAKGAFSSTLEPTVTLNGDLLTPKVETFILSQNAPMLKVWRKHVQDFSRYCVNNIRNIQTDRLTDSQTARKWCSGHTTLGGGIITLLKNHVSTKRVAFLGAALYISNNLRHELAH